MSDPTEKDFLKYTGNQIPRAIRLAWTILVVFCVYYLIAYSWPDFRNWLAAMK